MKKHLIKIGFIPLLGLMACSSIEKEQTNINQRNQQYEEDDKDGRNYGPYGSPYGSARRSGRRTGRRVERRN